MSDLPRFVAGDSEYPLAAELAQKIRALDVDVDELCEPEEMTEFLSVFQAVK